MYQSLCGFFDGSIVVRVRLICVFLLFIAVFFTWGNSNVYAVTTPYPLSPDGDTISSDKVTLEWVYGGPIHVWQVVNSSGGLVGNGVENNNTIVTIRNLTNGTYKWRVSAYEEGGGYSSWSSDVYGWKYFTISVSNNEAPNASRQAPSTSPVYLNEGDRRSFTVAVSDVNGNLDHVYWHLDSTKKDTDSVSGGNDTASWSYTFSSAGDYTVKATVYDDEGKSDYVYWQVKVYPVSPSISVTPSSRDFGSVSVGSSMDKTFAVTNAGSGTLTGTADVDSPFMIAAGNSYSLASGQTHTVIVRFSPKAAQGYTKTVSFTGGDSATGTVTGAGMISTYTITASAGTGGSISPSGTVSVASGESKTFYIAANNGYKISNVKIDGTSHGAISSHLFSDVTSNHTITASFSIDTPISYTITASAGTGGSISPSGTVSVASGESKTFYIAANNGYKISNVKIDGTSHGAISSHLFSDVTSNHTITASFSIDTPISYTITASAGTGGSISPSGTVSVASGESKTFYIAANNGYKISNVKIDGTSHGAISSHLFSDVTSNHTITASFSIDTPISYTITASAGTGGSISPSGTVSVASGESKTFYIAANNGYKVSNVKIDSYWLGQTVEYSFGNVTSDHTITASFSVNPEAIHTITASAGTGGSISPSGTVSVASGESKMFYIAANNGYKISNVKIDGTSHGAISSHLFSDVKFDHTITASFSIDTPISYTITASAGTGGSISPSGTVSVASGESKTFYIAANNGYKISNVKIDGTSHGAISSHLFSDVKFDHTITASFSESVTPSKPEYLTEEGWDILVEAVKNNPNPSLHLLTLQDIIDALTPYAAFLDYVGDNHFIGVVADIFGYFDVPLPAEIVSIITISSDIEAILSEENDIDKLLKTLDFVEGIGWMLIQGGELQEPVFFGLQMAVFHEPMPKEFKVQYGTGDVDLGNHKPLTAAFAWGSYITSVVVDYFGSLSRPTSRFFGQEPSVEHFYMVWLPGSGWFKKAE